jgi:hypothetical protein
MPDRFEQDIPTQSVASNTTADFSMSNFFHDAYDKGLVKAVQEHPKEAVVTAVGAVVGAVAAEATFGKALLKEKLVSNIMGPATDNLITRGIPITAEARAAALTPDLMKAAPWARSEAIRGIGQYAEGTALTGSENLSARGLSITPETRAMVHGLPITSETRAIAANPEVTKLAPWDRGPAVRSMARLLEESDTSSVHASPGRSFFK